MSDFFSGSLEPFWPHVVLLMAAVAASFAVAAGIVLENPKWSLANVLVVGGVAIEAACTLLLFGFDEGISAKQQSKIEAAEQRLVQYRKQRYLTQGQKDRIAKVTKEFPSIPFVAFTALEQENWTFVLDIASALRDGGWNWIAVPGGLQARDPSLPSEGKTIADHVVVMAPKKLEEAEKALVVALTDPDVIDMDVDEVLLESNDDVSIMTVVVGNKR
ncbi:MAG: hypothetical protein WA858_00650 [Xanthobacteraceae bacterium]